MELTVQRLQNAAQKLVGTGALNDAKAALFFTAARFASFAKQEQYDLDFSAQTFDRFQEAVVRYYLQLRRQNADETACRADLTETLGAYLTLMVCNDFQATGACLMLSPIKNDRHLLVSMMPGVQVDVYALTLDAIEHDFDYSAKYLSVRFDGFMAFLSDMIDKIEATPDEALNRPQDIL